MVTQSTLRLLISSGLSYGVVIGSSILKVPQIVKVLQHHKADGVSLASVLVELLSYAISTSWGIVQGLPFRDFGENFIIFLQLIVLVLLVAKLQKRLRGACVVLAVELVALYAFSIGVVPRQLHQYLLSGQILLNMSSRLPQVALNYKTRCRGQLSFLTFFLAFGGGVARTLTTAVNVPWEKGKAVMLAQFSVAATLNAIILLQMIYYQWMDRAKSMPKLDKRKGKRNYF